MASARTFEVEANAPPAAVLRGSPDPKTRAAVVGLLVAAVCCLVGFGVSPLVGRAGETAAGIDQDPDRLSGKLAFAGPAQLPRPSLGSQAPRASASPLRGMAAEASPAPARRPRLLCFHGKEESAGDFALRIGALRDAAELVCVDAPHRFGKGHAWWLMPPGERSFTTPVFEGWADTVAFVRQVWAERGPFDGILGFSQGAILIAAMAATGELVPWAPPPDGASAPDGPGVVAPRMLILVGSAVPGPYRAELAAMRGGVAGRPFRALHVIGDRDGVNPPEGAREVAAALGGDTWEHGGGHIVPMDEAAMARFASFLAGEGPGAAARAGAPVEG